MRQIVLLRGINIGPNKRVAMPRLRELLSGAGYEDVSTYVQSGNVVLSGAVAPEALARECEALIAAEFGFPVDVVVRTRDELAEVVRRDPLGDVATEPKRYQVTFLSAEPDPEIVERLGGLAAESERFAAHGRELYAWHPDGVARSRLWTELAGQGLGVTATSRNWNTVRKLLELADG
jgi:uncharacterized protein (DUF1697 family)